VQREVSAPRPTPRWAWAAVIFVILTVAGVFYAKWDPYFLKLAAVSVSHSLGSSIILGASRTAPAIGWAAAVSYWVAYFKDIWIALVVGLVVGAGVQTLLPRRWLLSVLGRTGWGSSGLAVAAAVPSMMCTCCSAPIAVSMKRSQVSTGAVFGYWLGNPVLNPATIVFMGFVLGWNWALLRIAVGLVLVAGGVYLGQRLGHAPVPATMATAVADATEDTEGPSFGRFLAVLGRLGIGLLPEYIVIVGILGAVRAWLFPAMSPALGHNLLLVVGLALAGTLFVIPTAGEIPLVQSLLSYGLGLGGAGALMITLPAISLPSMAMLSQAVPKRLLLELAAWVAVMGLVTAFLAHLLL
jgi:uncharacterized membrane protein YraQ (UPF0718 family)